jgi:hypothetical protein
LHLSKLDICDENPPSLHKTTIKVQALTKGVVVDFLHKAAEAVEVLTHHSSSNRWAFLLQMVNLEIRKTKAVVV